MQKELFPTKQADHSLKDYAVAKLFILLLNCYVKWYTENKLVTLNIGTDCIIFPLKSTGFSILGTHSFQVCGHSFIVALHKVLP